MAHLVATTRLCAPHWRVRTSDAHTTGREGVTVEVLAFDLGDDLAELDVNPFMVRPEGRGVVAVDALVVPRTTVT